MKPKKRTFSVISAYRTANGSFLFNSPVQDSTKGVWVNGSDITNSLIRLGLSPKLPAFMLKGSVIEIEQLEVTEAMLAENGGVVSYELPAIGNREARKIDYKTAGLKTISAEIFDLSETLQNVAVSAAINSQQHYAETKTYGRRAQSVVSKPIVEDEEVIKDTTIITPKVPIGTNIEPSLED